jgi:N-methylhydantoinase A/oxoprolinase/acetone carboxylase beta subunit
MPKPSLRRGKSSREPAIPVSHRRACFEATEEFRSVPVFAHRDLLTTQVIPGPAFIEDDYLTMIILPKQVGEVDSFGNVVIDYARGRFFDVA